MKNFFTCCLPIVLCILVSCKKESDLDVKTLPLSEFSISSVMCNGSASGKKIVEKGFCWNIIGEPSVNNNLIKTGGSEGEFHLLLDGLQPSTVYYIRPYCRTKTEIAYGSVTTYTTLEQPSVTTTNYSLLTHTSFLAGGTVDARGNSLLSVGICWAKSSSPTINNSKVQGSVNNANFSCNITDLDPNTKYYYRSYATFATGTVYGAEKNLSTYQGTVSDIDGNTYYTITIGGKVWMASNLKTTRYRDGSLIPYYTTANWANIAAYAGGYGKYNNSNSNLGFLYNYFAASDTRGLAPAGWHIPTNTDWQLLETALGDNPGPQMKVTDNLYWTNSTSNTNSSGFSSLAGGYRNIAGTDVSNLNEAHYWSASVSGTSGSILNVFSKSLYSSNNSLPTNIIDARNGLSVRCVKD